MIGRMFLRLKTVPIIVLPFSYWNVPNGKRKLLAILPGPVDEVLKIIFMDPDEIPDPE